MMSAYNDFFNYLNKKKGIYYVDNKIFSKAEIYLSFQEIMNCKN